mgnify:CR=1 FL=1
MGSYLHPRLGECPPPAGGPTLCSEGLLVASMVRLSLPIAGILLRFEGVAGPEVAMATETLRETFTGYSGSKTAPGGLDTTSTFEYHLEGIAQALADVPGGLDVLYEVARQRKPKEDADGQPAAKPEAKEAASAGRRAFASSIAACSAPVAPGEWCQLPPCPCQASACLEYLECLDLRVPRHHRCTVCRKPTTFPSSRRYMIRRKATPGSMLTVGSMKPSPGWLPAAAARPSQEAKNFGE